MNNNNNNNNNNIEELYNCAISCFKKTDYNSSEKYILNILEYIPNNSDVLNFYGRLKQFKGEIDESIDLLNQSILADNKNFMAHYNIALAYCIKKNIILVKKHFEEYIKLNPDNNDSKYYCNLYISKLHFDQLDIEETKLFYKKSKVPLFNSLADLLVSRIYNSTEEIEESRKLYYNTLLNIYNNTPDDIIIHSPDLFSEYLQFIYCYGFPLSYQGKNNKEILSLQCSLYRKIFPCLNYTSKYINELSTNNKIKIGFISTNFFNQSVSRDRMGIIRNLPREVFDVTVFFYFKPNDDLGNFIWDSDNTNIILPDTNIFERRSIIEEQKLHILIYCDIGMAPDTYFLAYSRLAPIQCNTWGHSDTSGIDTIDYYISSIYYEKEDNPENNYSEKLVLLDSLCTFYYKIIENPEIVHKNYFGFSSNTNIYLSSQVLFKLNPDFDNILNNILEKDPNGIIILIKMNLGSYIQDILINRLEKTLKSNMTRIHLVEWQQSERDFYKLLSIADVIIDPYPFGGCNTSFSAFSMGIPIITMPADFINGRFTYGFYKKMNILDLVAHDFNEYVELAYKCANDKTWRKYISNKILDNIHLIFNEIDSINTWINFSIKVLTSSFNNNPIFITNKPINNTIKETQINTLNKTPELPTISNINNNSFDTTLYSNNSIPKIIHFIHFGYTDFHFIHYYSIKTAYINNPTYTIYLYYHKEPTNNIYWNNIKSLVNLVYTPPPNNIFDNKLIKYAHKADIIRLQKLIEYGGIYLDIDVFTIKSFDDLLNSNKSTIMGFQAMNTQFQGLCNAVILSKPQSSFLKLWYEQYKSFDNSQWDYHSVHLPLLLATQNPELIDIKSQDTFFPISWFEFDILFKKNNNFTKLKQSYTLHLWETHLMSNLLEHINHSYFYIYNTPFTHIFNKYSINSNKPSILIILQDNNLNLINILKNYIYSFLLNENNIYIQFTSKYTNESLNYIQNIDDYYILLNTLSSKKIPYNDINNIIFFTESNLWNIINNFNKNNHVSIYAYIDSINTFKETYFDYIDYFITSSKHDKDYFSNYKNTIYIPFSIIKHDFLISNYDNNLYIDFYNKFNQNNNSIIKINDFISLENYNTKPLSTINNDTYIFYSIINNNTFDELVSIINIYNLFCQKYNLTNILLYIKCNLSNSFDNFIKNININYPILFNFNILNTSDINNIHLKSNCFISIQLDTSYIDSLNSLLYNNKVIIKHNLFIKEYLPQAYFYNYLDKNIICELMQFVYSSKNIKNPSSSNYSLFNSIKFYDLFNNITSNNQNNILYQSNNKSLEVNNKSLEVNNKSLEVSNKSLEVNNISDEFNNISDEFNNISDEFNNKSIEVNNKSIEVNNKSIEVNNISDEFNNKSKQIEVFIIGKINIFKNRMDKLYYDFLKHIIDSSDFHISILDTHNCEPNKTLNYYINKYCKTTNPIIYNIIYTKSTEQIISDLQESKLIKIYEIEDCYEISNIIHNINYFKYDYVIYRYNCEQMNHIMSKCTNTNFIHFPHYIDTSIYNNNINYNKKYDILIYGNLSDWYPFRNRLLKLIKNNKYNYYYLEHPGYNEYNEKDESTFITKKKLSNLINQSKITICTSSIFNYFVKKYIEISLSGSIICGDFPLLEDNIFSDCMCIINNNMSDIEILNQINNYINLSSIEYNNIITKAYNISFNKFSYEIGLNKFNSTIINLFQNKTKKNINLLDDCINDNSLLLKSTQKNIQKNDLYKNNNIIEELENKDNNTIKINKSNYYDATYDNFYYKTNCRSFQYYINNGLSQPYPRELNIISNYLKSNPKKNNLFIDIGAHIGTVSIPYSKLYKQILAFEPFKENYDLLEINIKLNNINNISTANLALSNKNTTAIFNKHDNNSGSYYMKEIESNNDSGFNVVKLDEFSFNIDVDFIKIDTEGSELFVLEGAFNTILKNKPIIQIETNECSNKFFNYDKKEIFDFMEQLDYKILDNDGNDPIWIYSK